LGVFPQLPKQIFVYQIFAVRFSSNEGETIAVKSTDPQHLYKNNEYVYKIYEQITKVTGSSRM
jgi:hypothetical protein